MKAKYLIIFEANEIHILEIKLKLNNILQIETSYNY